MGQFSSTDIFPFFYSSHRDSQWFWEWLLYVMLRILRVVVTVILYSSNDREWLLYIMNSYFTVSSNSRFVFIIIILEQNTLCENPIPFRLRLACCFSCRVTRDGTWIFVIHPIPSRRTFSLIVVPYVCVYVWQKSSS